MHPWTDHDETLSAPSDLVTQGNGIERDVLPTCREHGMGVIAWGPLGGGWLSGRR